MNSIGGRRQQNRASVAAGAPPVPEVSDAGSVALDVETTNPDLSSICQIGMVTFRDGAIVSAWRSYVDPEDYLDAWSIHTHGITPEMVVGSPTFGASPAACHRWDRPVC